MKPSELNECEVIETLVRIAAELHFNNENQLCFSTGAVMGWDRFETIDLAPVNYKHKTYVAVSIWGDGTTEIQDSEGDSTNWQDLDQKLVRLVISKIYDYIEENVFPTLVELKLDYDSDVDYGEPNRYFYTFKTSFNDIKSFLKAVQNAINKWVQLDPDDVAKSNEDNPNDITYDYDGTRAEKLKALKDGSVTWDMVVADLPTSIAVSFGFIPTRRSLVLNSTEYTDVRKLKYSKDKGVYSHDK